MLLLPDMDIATLAEDFASAGVLRSHASRVLRAWWRGNGQVDLDGLSIGVPAREHVRERFDLTAATVATRRESADGTVKLLLAMKRGGMAECVLMPAFRPDRAAACISSQIGCAMRCDFCASTRLGLERNLTAGEMAAQYVHLRAEAAATGRRLATLVFMGMGEPMHNLEQVAGAIRMISDPLLGQLGPRNITVSTVGIVSGIDQLAAMNLGVHLALSLHAPDDDTRNKLVPMNRKWNVADVMAAARRYSDQTDRIVNIEYCLLAEVNDHPWQADLLAKLLDGFRAHVNLIPYNTIGQGISGITYQRPMADRITAFLDILQGAGVVTHVRRTRGDDVDAACGQLRISAQPTEQAASLQKVTSASERVLK